MAGAFVLTSAWRFRTGACFCPAVAILFLILQAKFLEQKYDGPAKSDETTIPRAELVRKTVAVVP